MGSKCGPSIANIYVHILEEKFLTFHRPLFYARFIDDIFIITSKNFDLNILKNSFSYFKLNIVNATIVNFLDLNIKLNKITGSLIFSLYIKPTNTFSYLLTSSNHPCFIFKNIPKSLFFRIRRICSYYSDYLYYSRILIKQLVKRNYDFETICKVSRMVGSLDREDILPYRDKKFNDYTKNTIFFKLPFNFNYLNLEKLFNDSFKLVSKSNFLENFKLKLIYTMQPNLSSLFVHNFKLLSSNSYNFSRCSNHYCLICPYSNSNCFIILNGFYLPILSNSNCESENLIYIINCRLCNFYYVGQTKRIKRRMRDHLNFCIFDNTFNSSCRVVSWHFNKHRHNLNKDFNFFIFRENITELHLRLSIETQLITLFNRLRVKLMNDFIPDEYFFKNHPQLFIEN